ncbi:MAG: cobalamin-dependent protein [Candidatus Coatesbacteria bacterium]|nr:cobalamin-dependent protein [Candidatus Coatesbacteria bacterium]
MLRSHDRRQSPVMSQPMGLLYIASYLRKHLPGRFEFELFHTGFVENTLTQLKEVARSFQPDYLFVSSLTPDAELAHAGIRSVKSVTPGCKVLIGGPYPSTSIDKVLQDPNVDFAVLGEGEITATELMERLETGASTEDVRGIAYRRGGAETITEPRGFVEDLDVLPFPAWDLIDFAHYAEYPPMSITLKGKSYAGSITSRGCPFSCVYCHKTHGKKFRPRSAANVVEELSLLYYEYGVNEIQILDDICNLDAKRMIDICKGIVERGLRVYIAFPDGLRADLMTPEVVGWLKKAGTYKIHYAPETRSERLQMRLGKDVKFERMDEIVAETARQRIIAAAFFMLGFPSETLQELRRTVDYAVKMPFDLASFFRVVPYPNTRLREWAIEEGSKFDDEFEGYYNAYHFFSNISASCELTPDDIARETLSAYLRFYTRPRRLIRLLWLYPNRRRLIRNLLRLFADCLRPYLRLSGPPARVEYMQGL